jgi:predicted O-methyltransferase YrrM
MNDLSGLRLPPAVDAIYSESRARNFAMVSEPLTGVLLRTLAAAKRRGRFLELGTLASLILRGLRAFVVKGILVRDRKLLKHAWEDQWRK